MRRVKTARSLVFVGVGAVDLDAFGIQDADDIRIADGDKVVLSALFVQKALPVRPIRSIGDSGDRLPIQGCANTDAPQTSRSVVSVRDGGALFDSSVTIRDVDASMQTAKTIPEIFERMMHDREFDVSELGLTFYLRTFGDDSSQKACGASSGPTGLVARVDDREQGEGTVSKFSCAPGDYAELRERSS